MFGTKLKEAFKLKPHLIDGVFQYENLRGLNDNESDFLYLGALRLRPVIREGVKYLIGNIGGTEIDIIEHSESKLKGQESVQSFEVNVSLRVSDGVHNRKLVVSQAFLDVLDGEGYFKGKLASMVAGNIESNARGMLEV